MSVLYVSDLDGTLLRSNETTSEYTNNVINNLTERGMIFSYATARSLVTAKKVTSGINAKIPLIVYNGAFVVDNITEDILVANYFDSRVNFVLDDLFANKIYPIVYAYIDGKEKFSFVPELCSDGANKFLDSRKGDIRTNAVRTIDDLKKGNIFYITCIDEPQKLEPIYEKYRDSCHCVYQTEIYTNEQWLEIMPLNASKAKAIKQLQSLLKCEKVVVFGDGRNDIDMFEMADESYAVQNAHEDLKRIATSIIFSNDEDGVAKWLDEKFAMTARGRSSLPVTYREYEFSKGFPLLLMQGTRISDHVDFIHFHNCIEIALCKKGTMTWNLENTYVRVNEGDFLFLPPFYTHASFFPPQADTDVCCHYLFFNPQEVLTPFYPKGLPEEMFWYRYADFPKIFREGDFQQEAALVRLIIETILRKEKYCLQTVSGLLETLLIRLYRWQQERQAAFPQKISAESRQEGLDSSQAVCFAESRPENFRAQLFPAISYMDREYAQEPDIALLAQLCGLSEKQFLTCFRKAFRQTPLQYLRGVRIRKACLCLISTEDSILSIALETGFHSHSGFSRTFRDIMGCSPQTFRNEKREILKSAPKYAPYKASGEIGVEPAVISNLSIRKIPLI